MTHTVIREIGAYTVTTDGDRFYVNGKQAIPEYMPKGHALAMVLDTGCNGANGKRDKVGLTTAHVQIQKDLRIAQLAADGIHGVSPERDAEIVASIRVSEAKERAYDLGYNEGGEGYNPHRIGSEHTYR